LAPLSGMTTSGIAVAGPAPTFAALDLGTNNCRLLVARPIGAGVSAGNGDAYGNGNSNGHGAGGRAFEVVDAFSRIVRLGEGVERRGLLSQAAMDRTIEALRICAGKIRHRRVLYARQVATEACRRASNCGEFIARVRRET